MQLQDYETFQDLDIRFSFCNARTVLRRWLKDLSFPLQVPVVLLGTDATALLLFHIIPCSPLSSFPRGRVLIHLLAGIDAHGSC
jgi:hypothetical protein